MAEEGALQGVDDVLAYIDKNVSNAEGAKWLWGTDEVLELLADIRAGLTSAPEWSQVVESNLRAQLAAAEDTATKLRASRRFWIEKARVLRRERNHARRVAVLLEQALNAVEAQS